MLRILTDAEAEAIEAGVDPAVAAQAMLISSPRSPPSTKVQRCSFGMRLRIAQK